ncbi:Uncharacterised protein g4754 [Pycnogonum litorale]
MKFIAVIVIFAVSICAKSLCSEVSVDKDGGYNDIVVEISPDIDSNNATSLVQQTYEMFKLASYFLYNVTGEKLYFKKIKLFVPEAWPDTVLSELENQASYFYVSRSPEGLTAGDVDVRIDKSNPIHGNDMFTVQSKKCGHLGHYIQFTPEYLADKESKLRNVNAAKAFIHHWGLLRFGVFDEFGYFDDDIYPTFYHGDDHTVMIPNGCSNIQVNGNSHCNTSVDDPYQNKCEFVPSYTNNTNVHSSLMYSYMLPNMDYFCGTDNDTKHLNDTPTKHNFLCDYKSTWNVLTSSNDYKSVKTNSANRSLEFHVYKDSKKLRLILISDMSKSRLRYSRNGLMKAAIEQATSIFSQNEIEYRVITYSDQATVTENFKSLGNVDLNSIKPCLWCAVNKTKEVISNTNIKNVILVLDGDGDEDFNTSVGLLKEMNVRAFIVFYPGAPKVNITKWWLPLTKYIYSISENSKIESLIQLQMAFSSIINMIVPASCGKRIFNAMYSNDNKNSLNKDRWSSGSFEINPVVDGAPTIVTINCGKLKFNITQSNKIISTDRSLSLTGVNDVYAINIPKKTSGTINYSLKVKEYLILVPFLPSKNLIIGGWTNFDVDDTSSYPKNEPITIYASVQYKQLPCIVDPIEARVIYQTDNGWENTTVSLKDNGNGDPDLIADDGIYSGQYVGTYDIEGIYIIEIVIKSQNITTTSFASSNASRKCCGSRVPVLKSNYSVYVIDIKIPLGSFVLNNQINQTDFPPSRIGDLKISSVKSNISWTAPGGQYNHGCCKFYEIGFSESRRSLFDDNKVQWKNIIELTPDEAGLRQSYDVSSQMQGVNSKWMYFVIRGVNKYGISGRGSNIVGLLLPQKTTTDLPTINVTKSTTKQPCAFSKMERVLIIVFSFILLLIIIAILVILCYCIWQKSKTSQAKKTTPTITPVTTPGNISSHINLAFQPENVKNGVATRIKNELNVYTKEDADYLYANATKGASAKRIKKPIQKSEDMLEIPVRSRDMLYSEAGERLNAPASNDRNQSRESDGGYSVITPSENRLPREPSNEYSKVNFGENSLDRGSQTPSLRRINQNEIPPPPTSAASTKPVIQSKPTLRSVNPRTNKFGNNASNLKSTYF